MYALKCKNTQNGVRADLSRREVFIMSEKGQKDLSERIAKAVNNYRDIIHAYRETLSH